MLTSHQNAKINKLPSSVTVSVLVASGKVFFSLKAKEEKGLRNFFLPYELSLRLSDCRRAAQVS